MEQQWGLNTYFPYFSGKQSQQRRQPGVASDLVHFRKRISKSGVEKVFKQSIELHGKDVQDKDASIDTTVQENNITFSTEAKLHKKNAKKFVRLAHKEGISLRRSYRYTYNPTHPKRRNKASYSQRKL